MKKLITIVAGLVALCAAPAMADDGGQWFVKPGITQITMEKKLNLTVGGQTVPGAELDTKPSTTLSVAIGRYFAPHWAVVATVGIPPRINANGGGTIAPYGKLMEPTFGPMALTVQWHPVDKGVVRPYAGVGAAYMIIFKDKDGAVEQAHMTNDLAPVAELGSDFMITPKQGFYIDVKKALLETKATGNLFGAPIFPVVGKADVHPLVATAGLTFKF